MRAASSAQASRRRAVHEGSGDGEVDHVEHHAAALLVPVYDRIVAALFDSDPLHLDGTGIKALTPGQKGSHRGQVAAYCNEALTVYAYSKDKKGQRMLDFLRVGESDGYRGRVVADAANNMDRMYADGSIEECGCWYHARDKFEKAIPGAPATAHEAIAWMGTLFDVERGADERRTPPPSVRPAENEIRYHCFAAFTGE